MRQEMNTDWHRSNPTPSEGTFPERVSWHLEHQQACACEPIPSELARKMRDWGFEIPVPHAA